MKWWQILLLILAVLEWVWVMTACIAASNGDRLSDESDMGWEYDNTDSEETV
jgi:hypothetical protein